MHQTVPLKCVKLKIKIKITPTITNMGVALVSLLHLKAPTPCAKPAQGLLSNSSVLG